MSPGQQAETDEVNIFLNSSFDNGFRCLTNSGVDYLISGIFQSAGDVLGAAVVSIQPGLAINILIFLSHIESL